MDSALLNQPHWIVIYDDDTITITYGILSQIGSAGAPSITTPVTANLTSLLATTT